MPVATVATAAHRNHQSAREASLSIALLRAAASISRERRHLHEVEVVEQADPGDAHDHVGPPGDERPAVAADDVQSIGDDHDHPPASPLSDEQRAQASTGRRTGARTSPARSIRPVLAFRSFSSYSARPCSSSAGRCRSSSVIAVEAVAVVALASPRHPRALRPPRRRPRTLARAVARRRGGGGVARGRAGVRVVAARGDPRLRVPRARSRSRRSTRLCVGHAALDPSYGRPRARRVDRRRRGHLAVGRSVRRRATPCRAPR